MGQRQCEPHDDDEGEPGESEVRGATASPAGFEAEHEIRGVDGDRRSDAAMSASKPPPLSRSRTRPSPTPAASAGSDTSTVRAASVSSVTSDGMRPSNEAVRRRLSLRSSKR